MMVTLKLVKGSYWTVPFLLFVTITTILKVAVVGEEVLVVHADISDTVFEEDDFHGTPPPPFLSPMGAYPNPLQITEIERRSFHPVVKFPRQCWDRRNDKKRFVCLHGDYTTNSSSGQQRQLVDAEEFEATQQRQRHSSWKSSWISKWKRFLRSIPGYSTLVYPWKRNNGAKFIGRYDEDRVIYQSPLFRNNNNPQAGIIKENDDYQENNNSTTTTTAYQYNCTSRTVHVGIDLLGDVGTPVYACTDGIIHAVGYNAAWGDYGNVIVVQHRIVRENKQSLQKSSLSDSNATITEVFFYALYGHLDHASIRKKKTGDWVRRGQALGWMGDVHECGGWKIPHVHFQLALHAPITHDMPGAVCKHHRPKALVEYWDPRYVLGELH
jgi:murein DD-endopeptidase MepM/ murein hydrolase activator NlpD